MSNWQVKYGTETIKLQYKHVEAAIGAACSLLTKELVHNPRIKESDAYRREYNIHIEVLRLVERKVADAWVAYQKHLDNKIPRKKP